MSQFELDKYKHLPQSIALKHRLKIVFKANTTIEQVRDLVEKSRGHLTHLYKEVDENDLDNFVAYVNFPVHLSLDDCANDFQFEIVKSRT